MFLSSIYIFFKKFFSELIFSKKKLKSIDNENLFITYSTIIKKKIEIDDFFGKNLSLNNYEKSIKLIINVDNYSDKKKLNLIHNNNLKKIMNLLSLIKHSRLCLNHFFNG